MFTFQKNQMLVNDDLISLHLLLIMVCNFCEVLNVKYTVNLLHILLYK